MGDSPIDEAAILETLSTERLTKYFQRVESSKAADVLALYCWNQDAAGAINALLQPFEVCLRNSIAKALRAAFGADWFRHPKLTAYTSDIRNLTEAAAAKAQENCGWNTPGEADFIAATSFGFWREVCKPGYAGLSWGKTLRLSFPHGPEEKEARKALKLINDGVSRLTKLRNRIAHHEHVLGSRLERPGQMLTERYRDIVLLVSWMDPNFLRWMLTRDSFADVMARYPARSTAEPKPQS